MRILISLLLSCAMVSNVSQAAKRPMTVDDFLNIVSGSEDSILMSKGCWVLYSLSVVIVFVRQQLLRNEVLQLPSKGGPN